MLLKEGNSCLYLTFLHLWEQFSKKNCLAKNWEVGFNVSGNFTSLDICFVYVGAIRRPPPYPRIHLTLYVYKNAILNQIYIHL